MDEDDEDKFVLLKPIDASDDEDEQKIVKRESEPSKQKRRLSKLKPLALNEALFAEHRLQLRRVVSANCRCKGKDCRKPWAGNANLKAFDKLLAERVHFHQLPKNEADQVLFGMIGNQPHGSRDCQLQLHGHEVCQRAFCLLFGIGKGRFGKLRRACLSGQACPADSRFVPRENLRLAPNSSRPQCVEFLRKLYTSVAEPMPENKGEATADGDNCQNIKRRGKRPRHLHKHADRAGFSAGAKFLPPGTITEYLDLCRAEYPSKKISRRVFTRAWEEVFRDLLFIRPKTQHGQCNQCLRHKLLLRKLKNKPLARQGQLLLFKQHLARQYRDRCEYWKNRSDSRTGMRDDGYISITCIVDSIDHSKFQYPKSLGLTGKEFGTFVKPTLQTTCVIAHGYGCYLYLSEGHVTHDSSWTCEVVAATLHSLATHFDINWRKVCLILAGDNSSKELKNNSILRMLSALTASERIHSASLCTLESGHSHEDVDQFFSSLASEVARLTELHSPFDYVTSLQKWMNTCNLRRDEKVKEVKLVDRVRDWKTHLHQLFQANQLTGIGGPGAPHAFEFRRARDIDRGDLDRLDSRFWRRRGVELSDNDTVLKMKQYTSDEEYLISPPLVHIARRAFQDTAQLVPKVFTADRSAADDSTRDPKELKKFALKMRAEPYNLHRAAQHLERMAEGTLDRSGALPIGKFFGAGPAIGFGALAQVPAGVDYNPAPNRMDLRREQLPRGALHSFTTKLHEREMYRVAARLWAGGHMDWPAAKQLAEEAFKEVPVE